MSKTCDYCEIDRPCIEHDGRPITRLQAIDALIALDLPEWERDGDEMRCSKYNEKHLEFAPDGHTMVMSGPSGSRRWVLRRKRPATVTLEDVPIEVATRLYELPGRTTDAVTLDAHNANVLQGAAERALEALEKGEA